jgi:hypothetical protein
VGGGRVRAPVRAPVVVGAVQCGRNEGGPEGQRRGHCERGWATRQGACLGVPGALGQTMDQAAQVRRRRERNEGTLGEGGCPVRG